VAADQPPWHATGRPPRNAHTEGAVAVTALDEATETRGLRKNALGVIGAVALAMAFTGPAGSIYYGEAAASGKAGSAFAFSFILAAAGVLLMAHSVAQFSRKLETAGFGFTYVAHAFGPAAGSFVGWLLLFGYLPIPALLLAAEGALGHQMFATYVHVNVPWYVVSVVLGVVAIAIVNSGVRRSIKTTLVFLAWEIGVTTALFLTIIVKGGAHGNTLQPLNPANSPSIGGLAYGLLWGFVMFFGFESAGTLGEEAANPRRTVPRALFVAVGVMSLYYVLSAYAATIGVGIHNISAFNTNGWDGLARHYWGHWVGWLIDLTVLNSFFAILLASLNASSRVLYAMARAGVLPRRLATVSPRTQAPVSAGYALIAIVLIMLLVMGSVWGALTTWTFLSVMTAIALLLVYIAIHVSLPVYYRRKHPAEFSWWKHAVLPVIGALIVLLPIYGTVWPVAAYPLNLAPWFVVAWILLGVAYSWWSARRHAGLATVFRSVFEESA
jgi:amino acid transporter